MRILLCLNRDLASNIALNLLGPALKGHDFDIALSNGVGKKSAPRAEAIVQWQEAERAVVDEIEANPAEPRDGRYRSFRQWARETQSKRLHEFSNVNEGEGLAYVRAFAPDVIVSIRFGHIFKAAVIALPRVGILNLHSGILPEYRGILATFWAMLKGAPKIGCTLHYVSDGTIDTGPIAGVHSFPPARDQSLLWNIIQLYDGGAAMIADALAKLARGETLTSTPQNAKAGRYFSLPTQADVEAFLARGLHLYSDADYAELLAKYRAPSTAG